MKFQLRTPVRNPVVAKPPAFLESALPAPDHIEYDEATWTGVVRSLRADLRHWELVHGATLSRLRSLMMLAMPCMLALLLYRVSRYWHCRGFPRLARLCWSLQQVLTKADIAPWVQIGPGLMLGHSVCTVISAGTIGRNVIAFGCVMVGGQAADGRTPVIGDGATLGYRAMVLGGVTVAPGAFVGTDAMVLTDVAPGVVVVGKPARALVRKATDPGVGA